MFCHRCGHQAVEGDRYCRQCGQALVSATVQPAAGPELILPQGRVPLATFWRRLGAMLLDGLVWYAVYIAFVVVWLAVAPDAESLADLLAGSSPGFLVAGGVAGAALLWTFEAIGWSPGKRAVGLRIVRADGSAPGVAHGLLRYVGKSVSALGLGLGYLWVAWDRKRQGWHDKIADTYVVRVPRGFAFRRPGDGPPEVAASMRRRGPVWVATAAVALVASTACSVAFTLAQPQWEGFAFDLGAGAGIPIPPEGEMPAEAPALERDQFPCRGPNRVICFVVIGEPPEADVDRIAGYFERTLGVETVVLPPIPLAETAHGERVIDRTRDPAQLDLAGVLELLHNAYPDAWAHPGATIVGLTGHDAHLGEAVNFTFGARSSRTYAVVSSARMADWWFESRDPALIEARVTKMAGKYIGILHYGLEPSDDPRSPVFHPIGRASDLDRMQELPAYLISDRRAALTPVPSPALPAAAPRR